MKLTLRHEKLHIEGIRRKLRILHLSDIHFSPHHSYKQNLLRGEQIANLAASQPKDVIVMTGDLVSRTADDRSLLAARILLTHLRHMAPVICSMGNHETDLSWNMLYAYQTYLAAAGVTLLDNAICEVCGVTFCGLTLPRSVYRNANGSYFRLTPITAELVTSLLGECPKPCILLAHHPGGFPAYAAWGAPLVLSGHVHGGIVRLPMLGGILSPERCFFPPYSKGIYRHGSSVMEVSAGIGKFRLNDPAEMIQIELF